MSIQIGDTLPSMKVVTATAAGPHPTTTDDLFEGKRAVLFAVPGAFTPTCSEQHLPGFLAHVDDFAAKGLGPIVCLAVNDVFVMQAWARQTGAEGKLVMLADGSGELTRALGLEFDLSSRGLGVRAKRFAMVLDDRKVTHLAVEPTGALDVSAAERVLAAVG